MRYAPKLRDGLFKLRDRSPSERLVACEDETSEILQRAWVEQSMIAPLGFPGSPLFAVPPK